MLNGIYHLLYFFEKLNYKYPFFRYIPGNDKPMTYYFRPGVKVDKAKSDERKVTLKALTIESTGRYRCEVSTEAPSFATVSNFNDMFVVGKYCVNSIRIYILNVYKCKMGSFSIAMSFKISNNLQTN